MANNRLKRFAAFVLSTALIAGTMSGCGKDKNDPEEIPDMGLSPIQQGVSPGAYAVDKKFTLNCSREVGFNPYTTTEISNLLCTDLMYDHIYNVAHDFSYSSDIIKESSSEDGLSWHFVVNSNIKFWDGSFLTAKDVAYSIQRAMRSPRFSGRFNRVYGVSASSDTEFSVNLAKADMMFPASLDIPIIKNESVGEDVPMGTGPYKLNGDRTQLDKFEGHRDASKLPLGTIYLKEYREIDDLINAYESSEVDLVTNDPLGTFNLGYGNSSEVRSYPTTNMHYIGFNSKGRFFSSAATRKAVTYIIDRETIVRDALKGAASPASLPMNPSCQYYNHAYSDLLTYSISRAEDALDAAEVEDIDDDGFREIMITGIAVESDIDFIVADTSPSKVSAARMIASSMEALGLKVHLRELPWDTYKLELMSGKFDMYYGETKLPPSFSVRELVLQNGLLNYGKFADAALEETVENYLNCPEKDRQKNADLMFKSLTDVAPITPICFEKQQVVTHRGIVSGIEATQYNIFNNLSNWKINFD